MELTMKEVQEYLNANPGYMLRMARDRGVKDYVVALCDRHTGAPVTVASSVELNDAVSECMLSAPPRAV